MLTLCHNYFGITPSNKSSKDGVQQTSRRKFAFGVILLILVVVLWVVSAELTKYIYFEKKLDRPFLVTYVRSSLLFVYLIVLCFTPPTRDPCRPANYTQLLEPSAETDDENCFHESVNSLGDSTFVPVRAGETTDSDDAAPRAVRFNKVAEVRVMSAAQAREALVARLSWTASLRASQHAQRQAAAAATRRHLKLALLFCAPWFISNYLYRMSLLHWSTSSATVYTSSCGALALTLSAARPHATHDRLDAPKTLAVTLTAAGLVVLGLSEGHQTNWMGILSALGSGLCYAVHLLLWRRELRRGDGINAPLLVGLVGCACGCLSWTLGGALCTVGVERCVPPPAALCLWLLLDAALQPLLIETLWLWGRSLTTPQTASGLLALSLPLSALVDATRGGGGSGSGWARGVAAALAAAGWLAAVAPPTTSLHWLTDRMHKLQGFSVIRNIPDLDEQSEALMSPDEPT